jgi:hypothetical protein
MHLLRLPNFSSYLKWIFRSGWHPKWIILMCRLSCKWLLLKFLCLSLIRDWVLLKILRTLISRLRRMRTLWCIPSRLLLELLGNWRLILLRCMSKGFGVALDLLGLLIIHFDFII